VQHVFNLRFRGKTRDAEDAFVCVHSKPRPSRSASTYVYG
jgi:hypothetical protein